MKKAFTLIELIFVIVIIGLLSAVAVPKFLNLKQNAEASNVVKATVDAAQQAVETAVNYIDLEDNSSFKLEDIVKLDGKNWKYDSSNDGKYHYDDGSNEVASVTLDVKGRKVTYSIDCDQFSNDKTKDKCKKLIGDGTTTSISREITF